MSNHRAKKHPKPEDIIELGHTLSAALIQVEKARVLAHRFNKGESWVKRLWSVTAELSLCAGSVEEDFAVACLHDFGKDPFEVEFLSKQGVSAARLSLMKYRRGEIT